ncbi:conserved hypothetical protein [Frankia canadensis]|uniref:Uncharacterized protein n=1 Tax=Frankia canadensis TaxID=1836972 RepID=A0A2I2KN82_9ACTN|nr:hypothetical protein [Frankia canadensis]SNQ47120.1 conserved hypothetical protein [Frankia canadensis]SOU54410.1 conserved hypothetical protein [Frankia canadensis]
MITDDELAAGLRGRAAAITVQPPEDLWAGVRARVPGERRRRFARRAVPAVTLAVVAASIATGLTLTSASQDAVVTPAVIRPSPPAERLHPITFTPAESSRLDLECAQSAEGPADPARVRPLGLTVWAAVRDRYGATVIFTNGLGFSDCDVPADTSGRLKIDDAYTFSFSAPSERSTGLGDGSTSDLQFVDRGSHEIGGAVPVSPDRDLDTVRTDHVAAGVVSARVARLTVTSPSGEVTEVPIQNGRFVLRSVQIDGAEPGPKPGDEGFGQFRREDQALMARWRQEHLPLILAYDRDGKVLAREQGG